MHRALALLMVAACSNDDEPPNYYPTGDRGSVGDPVSGDAAVGDPLAGDTAGDPFVGDAAGDPFLGDATAGDTTGGDVGPAGQLCTFPSAGLIFPPPAIGIPADTSAFSFGTVSVTNCSGVDVVVQAPTLSAATDPEIAIDFLPFSGTATLVPRETVLVELLFTPERVASDFSGALEIIYGPSNDVAVVPLSGASVADPGTCLLQVGPTLLSAAAPLQSAMQVETTASGDAVNDTFMVVNIGRTSCTVTNIGLMTTGPFSFPYPTQVETPTTLAFRQLRLINLRFAPTSTGVYSASVTVAAEDGTHTMSVVASAY